MDLLIAHALKKRIESKTNEKFRNDDEDEDDRRDHRDRRDYDNHRNRRYDDDDGSKMGTATLIIYIVLWVVFGLIAVWLSWSSNSVAGYNALLKILFAIFAFLFAGTYIIFHIICKLDLLHLIKMMQMQQQMQMQASKGAVGGRR